MAEIDCCHITLNGQLAALGLQVIDVAADGNSFFRAASRALYDNELHHSELRNLTADKLEEKGCILDGVSDVSSDNKLPFEAHVNTIRTPGIVVSQDTAIALADVINVWS